MPLAFDLDKGNEKCGVLFEMWMRQWRYTVVISPNTLTPSSSNERLAKAPKNKPLELHITSIKYVLVYVTSFYIAFVCGVYNVLSFVLRCLLPSFPCTIQARA